MGSVASPQTSMSPCAAAGPCAPGFDPDVLGRTPLFGGMPDECRCILTDRMDIRAVPNGQPIYRECEPARELFIVAKGQLSVRKGEQVLGTLGVGDFFGELSFLDMQPRNNTVTADEDCVVYAIPYAALRSLYERNLRAYALIVMNLAREVSRRLRKMDMVVCGKLPCGGSRS